MLKAIQFVLSLVQWMSCVFRFETISFCCLVVWFINDLSHRFNHNSAGFAQNIGAILAMGMLVFIIWYLYASDMMKPFQNSSPRRTQQGRRQTSNNSWKQWPWIQWSWCLMQTVTFLGYVLMIWFFLSGKDGKLKNDRSGWYIACGLLIPSIGSKFFESWKPWVHFILLFVMISQTITEQIKEGQENSNCLPPVFTIVILIGTQFCHINTRKTASKLSCSCAFSCQLS